MNTETCNGCVEYLKNKGFYAYTHNNKVFLDIENEQESFSLSLSEEDIISFNSLLIEELMSQDVLCEA